jgi:catechol 2,3-dioxygenase-like lactoylglutathione lyase family enzyme
MAPTIERISAVTFRVVNMTQSLRFYRDVLGMELLYGGEGTGFSSLRPKDTQSAILKLEQGKPVPRWGRLIFHVTNVDALWNHLKDRGFDPCFRAALTFLSQSKNYRPEKKIKVGRSCTCTRQRYP